MSVNTKRALLPLAIASALVLSACGESTSSNAGPDFNSGATPAPTPPTNPPTTPPTTPNPDFEQRALLTNLADNVISPTFEQFVQVTGDQLQAVEGYCQQEIAAGQGNATSDQVNTARMAAQASWRSSMNVWQQAEMMQLGPLIGNSGFLRSKIYAWPLANSCNVDFEVINFRSGEINGQPYNIANRAASRRGLAALEYLLFNDNLDHSCTVGAQPQGWNSETEQARKEARCLFAGEVARDLNTSAQELVTAWDGDNGFADELKQAGTAGNQFSTELEAINRISDAMFYLDTATKDGKLAAPLGLFSNVCGSQACPEAVESIYANNSLDNIENNLLGFQKLLTGGEGIGFTDFLIDVGDSDTATTMTTNVEAAISNVQAYQSTLAQALADNEAQVTESHARVKAVTDTLKADFINSLALELPQTSAGDND